MSIERGGFIGAGVIDRLCARQPSLKICIFEDLADLAKLRVVTRAMAMHEAMFTMSRSLSRRGGVFSNTIGSAVGAYGSTGALWLSA